MKVLCLIDKVIYKLLFIEIAISFLCLLGVAMDWSVVVDATKTGVIAFLILWGTIYFIVSFLEFLWSREE